MKANSKVTFKMGVLKGKVGILLAKNKCKEKGKRAVQVEGEVVCITESNIIELKKDQN